MKKNQFLNTSLYTIKNKQTLQKKNNYSITKSHYAQTSNASTPSNLYTNYHFLRSNTYGKNIPENTSATQHQQNPQSYQQQQQQQQQQLQQQPQTSVNPNYTKSFNEQYHSMIMPSSSPNNNNIQPNYTTYSSANPSSPPASNTYHHQQSKSAKNPPTTSSSYQTTSNNYNRVNTSSNPASSSNTNGAVGGSSSGSHSQYDRVLSSVNQNNQTTTTNAAAASPKMSHHNNAYLSNYTSVYDTLNNNNSYSTYLQNELKSQIQQQQALLTPNFSYSRSKSVSEILCLILIRN